MAHTEALSSLVLGSTLASGGRIAEALDALDRAHELGLRQGSALFVSEALARRARLHWTAGDTAAARQATLEARAQAGHVVEPLRASALALMEVLTAVDEGQPPDPHALALLGSMQARSRHPLVQVRHWRAQAAAAAGREDHARALAAARQQAAVAQQAGLLEWLCEALALVGRFDVGAAADALRNQAQTLAHAQGFGWLADRTGPASMNAK